MVAGTVVTLVLIYLSPTIQVDILGHDGGLVSAQEPGAGDDPAVVRRRHPGVIGWRPSRPPPRGMRRSSGGCISEIGERGRDKSRPSRCALRRLAPRISGARPARPVVIREALWSEAANTWTETGLDLRESGLDDDGDLWFSDREPGSEARARIEQAVHSVLDSGRRPLLLGGDHSITYPAIRGLQAALSSARDPAPRRAPRPVPRVPG